MPADFDVSDEKEKHVPQNAYESWVAFSRRTKICVAAIVVVMELLAIVSLVTSIIYGFVTPPFPTRNITWDSATIEVVEGGRAELVLRTNLTEVGIYGLKNEIVENVCYPAETTCMSVGSSFRFNPCEADDSFVENGYLYDCSKLCGQDCCANPRSWFVAALILSVVQITFAPLVVMEIQMSMSGKRLYRHVALAIIWVMMIIVAYNAYTVGFAIFLRGYTAGTPVNYVLE